MATTTLQFSMLCLPWFLLFLLTLVSATTTPRLRVIQRTTSNNLNAESSKNSKDLKTFYYTQTLDHFNYRPDSFITFQHRYMVNSKYWGGAKTSSPIFVYCGEEASLDTDAFSVGFLNDFAPRFNALIVYIEHRYYGKSMPFGSFDEAFDNSDSLGYFNSAQALADYAEVIVNLKKNLSAESCPVIVIGGSYGGMLAAWFRLKYPHIAIGALASSAPALYLDEKITPPDGYYTLVTKDFREASESCYNTIRQSWSKIDEIASTANGLSLLSQKFKTCSHMNSSNDLKNYLKSIYAHAAQYDTPPDYPVNMICNAIDGASKGTDILSRIFAGMVANKGKKSCYVNEGKRLTEADLGWAYQTCTDLLLPMATSKKTMFPVSPFVLKEHAKSCQEIFGVTPRPHWIITEFGGHDIKLTLKKFGSNIIFSNGLRDPFSIGGVLHNISHSLVALKTVNGSHCLDLLPASKDDPDWLVRMRNSEAEIIKGWIAEYHAMRKRN